MQKNAAKRKKPLLIYKPYLEGNWRSALAAKRGLKLLGYQAAFIFFYLFVGQAMMFDNFVLRLVINLLLLLAFASLLYMDGIKTGEDDVAFAEIALSRKEAGQTISQGDLDRCFHPLKGLLAVLAGMLPIVLICLVFALIAEVQVYRLGALPSWLEAYRNSRPDISLALSYYSEAVPFQLQDILRIIVRLLIFPYVNIVGTGDAISLLWLERLSPLLVMIVPMAYAIGYRQGKMSRARVHGGIASNQVKRVRRERRERKKRREKAPNQLI
ncbi:MAG: hypothetical protein GX916_07265 [Clostridiales bacterium]|jgi:hypothetical protein|nr:hypothetical protein [Clostridiales bacterium]